MSETHGADVSMAMADAIQSVARIECTDEKAALRACDEVLRTFADRIGPSRRARASAFMALRLALNRRVAPSPAQLYAVEKLDRALVAIRTQGRRRSEAAFREIEVGPSGRSR